MLPLPSIDCWSRHHGCATVRAWSRPKSRLVVGLEEIGIGGRAVEPFGADPLQHLHRVVRRRPPQRVIELAEDLPRAIVPAPPQVERELVQAVKAIGKWGGVGETFFRHVRVSVDQFGEAREIDVAAGDHGDDLAGAGAAAERRGDRRAARAFGDDVHAIGGLAHRRRDLVERHHDRAVDEVLEQRPHRRQHRLAAGAVDERRLPAVEAAGFAAPQRQLERRRGFGFGGIDTARPASARASPIRCPTAVRRRRARRPRHRHRAGLRGSRGRPSRCRQ